MKKPVDHDEDDNCLKLGDWSGNNDDEAKLSKSSRVHICIRFGSSKGRSKQLTWVPSRGFILFNVDKSVEKERENVDNETSLGDNSVGKERENVTDESYLGDHSDLDLEDESNDADTESREESSEEDHESGDVSIGKSLENSENEKSLASTSTTSWLSVADSF